MFIFCHFHSFLLLLISWYFSGGSLWSWISRTKRGAGDTKSDFTFSQQEQGEAAPWKSKNKGRQRLQKSPHTFCLKNLLLLAGQDTIVSGNMVPWSREKPGTQRDFDEIWVTRVVWLFCLGWACGHYCCYSLSGSIRFLISPKFKNKPSTCDLGDFWK